MTTSTSATATRVRTRTTAATTTRAKRPGPRTVVIDQLEVEWRSLGRTEFAVRALQEVARRDPALGRLVFGDRDSDDDGGAAEAEGRSARCPTPCDLVTHMRRASGRVQREEAARLVRVLLREAGTDPFVPRLLVQALLPGLIRVAGKLRWGQGGDWQDGEEFFCELLTTTWCVIQEWAGQDRPYAVRDLLSAIRCRVRRQLFRAKELASRIIATGADDVIDRGTTAETLLDELARAVVDERGRGMPLDEAQVLYGHNVLGYSIAELAALTGRDRRGLSTRRNRARRRLCA
jgi:DNA-directed RNA polymerase specialized sigma24 family protein